jgi:hypothetical protein
MPMQVHGDRGHRPAGISEPDHLQPFARPCRRVTVAAEAQQFGLLRL